MGAPLLPFGELSVVLLSVAKHLSSATYGEKLTWAHGVFGEIHTPQNDEDTVTEVWQGYLIMAPQKGKDMG